MEDPSGSQKLYKGFNMCTFPGASVLRAVEGVIAFLGLYKDWKSKYVEGAGASWLNDYNVRRQFVHFGPCANRVECTNFLLKSTRVLEVVVRELRIAFEPIYESHVLSEFVEVHLGDAIRTIGKLRSLLRIDEPRSSNTSDAPFAWPNRPFEPASDIKTFVSSLP
jgi:hypothetical protein